MQSILSATPPQQSEQSQQSEQPETEQRETPRVTLRDVAATTGVSEASVSISLRGLSGVSEDTRRRVVDTANRMGYTPNLAASTLAARRSGIIGVIIGDLHNPYFADLSDAVADAAEADGLRVLLGTGYYDPRRELEALETFRDLQADGVILVGAQLEAEVVGTVDPNMAVVAVGCLPRAEALDRVVVDNRLGSRLATEHVISQGHTNIAHIHGGPTAIGQDRLDGFTAAMTAAGLPSDKVVGGGFTAETGSKAAVELLDDMPTAIVACSDLVAWGAIAELSRHAISVPDNVSMVGYDNATATALGDFLTTVDGDRTHLGASAVKLLIERLEGRTTRELVTVEPNLVVRHSTAKPIHQ